MPAKPAVVAEAMRPRLPSCTLRTPVMEVARRMQEEGVRALIVASAGSDLIAGVVTDLDLLRALTEGQSEGMASDIMTLEPPPTVASGETLADAVERLRESGGELLVVTEGTPARPVGILGFGEVAAHVARG